MKNSKPFSMLVRVNSAFVSVVFLFLLIAGMTSFLSMKMTSDSISEIMDDNNLNQLFLYFFGSENRYYLENHQEINDISISRIGFQLATNIKIDDIRTLFERELPGFAEFDTKIQVAGQGTDLTNLPIESSPPIEVLLKERAAAQDSLADNNPKDTNPQPAPIPGKKTIFIYQSHSWESYLPLLKNVSNPDDSVSSNNRVNVVAVGDMLAKDLKEKGIGVEHSTINAAEMLHAKGWDTNYSYKLSRGLVQEAMAGNHDLAFNIDIHRDSLRKSKTTVQINGKSFARLDFIVGEENPNFKQNLELARALHAAIEKKYPGLSRGVLSKNKSMGNGVYNQDLSPRAMLLEVGGVDNNLEELQNAMDAFADVFSDYYWKLKDAKAF
jgi:stage II sporulation protein P